MRSEFFRNRSERIEGFGGLQTAHDKLKAIKEKNGESVEWIFRGHAESKWKLKSTLERCFDEFDINPAKRLTIEGGLLRRFKRQCHNYATVTPVEDNVMEWLALMRHYGAPVRLLDWTYSFWVATFFAVENANPNQKEEKECSIWALNQKYIWKRLKDKYRGLSRLIDDELPSSDPNVKQFRTFRRVFMSTYPFVCPINAYGFNERLVIQQGTFLCPGDVAKPFEKNLAELAPKRDGKPDFGDNIWEFRIRLKNLQDKKNILGNLYRMNMTRAALYPGLDGFSQSLKTILLTLPEALKPDPSWR